MKIPALILLALAALVSPARRASAAEAPAAYPARPDTVTFKKSAVWLEESPRAARAGDDVTLKVRYRLDASDTWGPKPTQLVCIPLGPWIDNPDGKINKGRRHVGYPGLGTQVRDVSPGEGVVTFTWRLRKAFRHNGCTFLCRFRSPDGANWPWEWRGGSLDVARDAEPFRLAPEAPGGLFPYGETPRLALAWGGATPPGARAGTLTVRDVAGRTVLARPLALDSARARETLALDAFAARGTFSATVEVPGVGADTCFFGTVPAFARAPGRPTPFGVTNVGDARFARIARDLGFSRVRLFEQWKLLQPAPDVWQLEELDAKIEAARAAGLEPWICLYAPPAWALPEGQWSVGFEPAPFDLDAWRAAVGRLARRYAKRVSGFEMLNEIVPGGKCADPVRTYAEICRAGAEAAKAADPALRILLAGGLWPRNYRLDLLNAGVGAYIDELPVHYATYEGVAEARADLAARGLARVDVTDDETAAGASVWDFPPADALAAGVAQCLHVMTRWPDELCAGARAITYFGGAGDPCGNWSYMIDAETPRPCAVTLAVVQGKLAYAEPVGKFFLEGLPVHLFAREGRAVAFVRAPGREGVKVRLPAKGAARVTDFQGNETAAPGGVVAAGDMPVIVEDVDLDALRLHAALRAGAQPAPAAEPLVVAEPDARGAFAVPATVVNTFPARRRFRVSARAAGEGENAPVAEKAVELELAPGEARAIAVVCAPARPAARTRLALVLSADGLPAAEKPFVLCAVDPASAGELVKNGGFEEGLRGWGGKGEIADAPDGAGRALRFTGAGARQWRSAWQEVAVPAPGESYLYTCWMRGEGQGGGSNVTEHFSDGTPARNYYMPAVFSMGGKGSAGWRLMVKRFDTHPNTRALTLAPVCDGNGRTYVDNVSLTRYRGTDFAALAARRGGAGVSSPVPLCCENQVRAAGGYAWTPANLSGVASFSWDAEGLLLSCAVTDDASAPAAAPAGADGPVPDGDMLALALFPEPGADGGFAPAQLRWYMSLAAPGGGSGAVTLYRPAAYARGGKAGQLAKDSSVYEVSFRREGGRTLYDLRIPWTEIPGFSPAPGASLGCSLVLTDADGGAARGRMVWGADLGDTASGCGVLTLRE